jgi:two-component system, response regulator, stage 0 sporulation protein F
VLFSVLQIFSIERKKPPSGRILELIGMLKYFPRGSVMKQTVMVVDDRVGIRKLLLEVLDGAGYNVLATAGGAEALEKIGRHSVDLVLLDMKMSGMNGLETLAALKRISPTVKILIMTAYEELEVLKEAARLGACGHISKPFDIEDLKQMIASSLHAASA